jgi:hypothetical protein
MHVSFTMDTEGIMHTNLNMDMTAVVLKKQDLMERKDRKVMSSEDLPGVARHNASKSTNLLKMLRLGFRMS